MRSYHIIYYPRVNASWFNIEYLIFNKTSYVAEKILRFHLNTLTKFKFTIC